MTLCTFFKTTLWLNACFKFYMWITYSCSSCKLAASFPFFQFLVVLVKMVNHNEVSANNLDIECQLQENILNQFFSL